MFEPQPTPLSASTLGASVVPAERRDVRGSCLRARPGTTPSQGRGSARRLPATLCALLVWAGAQQVSLAADGPEDEAEAPDSLVAWLSGGWLTPRASLAAVGVELEASYAGDVVGNLSGGQRRGVVYMGLADLALGLELEQLVGWPGASLLVRGLANHGASPTDALVGDRQWVSNLDGPAGVRLHEAWLRQDFGPWASLVLGIFDLNSEFDVIETAALFLNSSHGIGADYSHAGHNGPSVFPTTALAAWLQVRPVASTYVQAGVFDGVPGDPDDPAATVVRLRQEDGVLLALESGLVWGDDPEARDGKVALGSWLFSGDFDDVRAEADAAFERRGNYGLYALGEATLWRGASNPAALSLFARVGAADGNVNPIGTYVGGGAVLSDLTPWLGDDRLGLSAASARMSPVWRQAELARGAAVPRHETTLEVTYAVAPLGWLEVQPDVQVVLNPGASSTTDTALVAILRLVVLL